MKLALSVRVGEAFGAKDKSSLTIEQFIDLARGHGYSALCMRASVAGVHTPGDTVRDYSERIQSAGLEVSMITGDLAIPRNDEQGPQSLRNITPYLDLAESFGAGLLRVCMKQPDDIPWAQRAADEARERGLRLAHQSHCASLFETVSGALETLQRIGRENFGLIYEPANWFVAGQPYGASVIRQLAPYIFNVYVQNHRQRDDAPTQLETWTQGRVGVDHIGIWETGGVDFAEVFRGLSDIGYSGYVTVHQAFADVMPIEEAVQRSAVFLSASGR